jgi:hypothetical protein
MIDFDRKLVFVHFPKAGGSSIASTLLNQPELGDHSSSINTKIINLGLTKHFKPSNSYHDTADKIYEYMIANDLDPHSFDWFIVIRNPWERAVSYWNYHSRNNDHKAWNGPFAEYLQAGRSKSIKVTFSDFMGTHMKNHINVLHAENLNEEFADLMEDLGHGRIELPYVNTDDSSDWINIHTPETIEYIRQYAGLEIEMGYTPEQSSTNT